MCSEETLNEIQHRYLVFNQHARSYTWKHHGAVLDMTKTLEANGIADLSEQLRALALDDDDDTHIPCVELYYNDDLTVA